VRTLPYILQQNREWAEAVKAEDPEFFARLARQQTPKYLWIGCADSRVPANEILGMMPGELFVHRNVANVVVHTDLNCLSVLQYAIDVLKVEHVIVVGHYGCGGVRAALQDRRLGLIDNWLRHVRDIRDKYVHVLEGLDEEEQMDRLCELNVIEQAMNVCQTTIIQESWDRGGPVNVHGWIYGLRDGILRDLSMVVTPQDDPVAVMAGAVEGVRQRTRDQR
jgi:carbonic anhydrase